MTVTIPAEDLPSPALDTTRLVDALAARNLRDLGGVATADGRTVRRGLVFRSGHLHQLTAAEAMALGELGIRLVCDFRYEGERHEQPSEFPEPAPRVVLVPIGDSEEGVPIRQQVIEMLSGDRPLAPRDFWEAGHTKMVQRAGATFARFVASLDADDALPVLFHCTAGKDRTGVAAGLLLDLLGVPDDVIVDDFLATNLRTPARAEPIAARLAEVGIDVHDALPVLGVTRRMIVGALAAVREGWGNTEAYLVAHGLDPAVPAHLRERLLAG